MVKELHIKKLFSDEKMIALKNTQVKPSMITTIINDDIDIYGENGKLLLKFRKNKLPLKDVDAFFDNVISFAKRTSSNRGSTSGSKTKNVKTNPKVMSNILGHFDKFSPSQKMLFRKLGMKTPLEVRQTRFNVDYPEKFQKLIPLIKDIDELYKKYTPTYYAKQHAKAKQTFFKIADTSFTTITTNVNFQTTLHKDKGDDSEGFGNLAVIERGKYSGGETCFPQYGIGVNVRMGDILFMDVHEWHANLLIKLETKDAIRLSIVCYLRYNVWTKTKGKSRKFMLQHNKTVKRIRGQVHN
jgi:hypothetical protein